MRWHYQCLFSVFPEHPQVARLSSSTLSDSRLASPLASSPSPSTHCSAAWPGLRALLWARWSIPKAWWSFWPERPLVGGRGWRWCCFRRPALWSDYPSLPTRSTSLLARVLFPWGHAGRWATFSAARRRVSWCTRFWSGPHRCGSGVA